MGDVADLTAKAYDIARMIPVGHVTTYGHIAKLAGYPTYSRYSLLLAWPDGRHVGNAMKMLPTTTDIPWQRVISAKGIISPRGDEGQGVARQKTALEGEGVEVVTLAGGGGEKVDVRRYGWFPEQVDL